MTPDTERRYVVPNALRAWTTVQCFELDSIVMPDGFSLNFMIEIQQLVAAPGHVATFRARFWRTEMFELVPTCGGPEEECSQSILVRDDTISETPEGTDMVDVVNRAMELVAAFAPPEESRQGS